MVKSLMHWLRPYNRKSKTGESPASSNCSSPVLKRASQKSSSNSPGKITLHKITDIDDPADNPFILTGRIQSCKIFFYYNFIKNNNALLTFLEYYYGIHTS